MPPLHQQGRQHNLEIATCSAVGDLATLRSKRRIDHLLAMQSFVSIITPEEKLQ